MTIRRKGVNLKDIRTEFNYLIEENENFRKIVDWMANVAFVTTAYDLAEKLDIDKEECCEILEQLEKCCTVTKELKNDVAATVEEFMFNQRYYVSTEVKRVHKSIYYKNLD